MKKRILSLLLALVMIVGMIPMASLTAHAAASTAVYIDGILLSDSKYMASGTRYLVTTKPSGGYAYYKDGVLTLHNYEMTATKSDLIKSSQDLTVTLSGSSTLTSAIAYDVIDCGGALTMNGTGSITINKTGTDDNVIYASTVTMQSGTWNITTNTSAIYSRSDMVVSGGTLNITQNGEYRTIYSGNRLTINGTSTVKLTSKATQTEAVQAYNIDIEKGTVNVTSLATALHARSGLTVAGGNITVNYDPRSSDGQAILIQSGFVMKSGRLTITADGMGIKVESGLSQLTGGKLTVNARHACFYSNGAVTVENCDLEFETQTESVAFHAVKRNITLTGSSAITIVTPGTGINCNMLTIEKLTEELLIQAQTQAVNVSEYRLSAGDLAVSYALKADGSNPKTDHASYDQYIYIRPADIYVGGVPMAMGDYLAQGNRAASTYKLTDKYAHADLNGDTVELCLENFHITTTGSVVGVVPQSSLKLVLYGTNTITTETGAGIHLTNGSLSVLIGGTLDIKSGGDGIKLDSGNYRHSGAEINITAGGMGINSTKEVEITSGELNIKSGTYGISCNKFSMSGGKLLACGNTRAIDETMGFNYSPLPIFASTSPSGTLGTYKYANHNSYKAISIGYTTAPVLSIPGDVDNDGDVDMDDAIYLLFHVNFPTSYPINQPANFDGLGETDMDDAIHLLFHVNFPASYPLH